MTPQGPGRKALALLAAGAVGLAACSTTAGDEDDGAAGATFTYAYDQEFDSYNSQTSGSNVTQNTIVMNRVTPGFYRFAPDGSLEPETVFGSYTKTSDDPLTIEYAFADGAVWSDGEPIDCDDAWLQYIANSGRFVQLDDAGQPVLSDLDEDGTVGETEATPLFDSAGTTGYDLISDLVCSDGDKAFTVTYSEPFADWEGLFDKFLPAHVLEEQAGVEDFIAAAQAGDQAAMVAAGEFWSTGWSGFAPGELPDEALIPSAGPYKLQSWEAGQSITLVANDRWWGEAPKSPTVVIRFVPGNGQAQALQNREIQAMDPQPDADLVDQLDALGDSVVVESADSFTFEHLDFNFRSPVFSDLRVRQAFALCVPRQKMVDDLIKPANENAIILDSRYFLPFQDEYEEVAAAIVDDQYSAVDIAGAQALLAEAQVADPTVRVGYIGGNQRRADQYTLIHESCGQAGFTIVDGGSATFFDDDGELANGNFDVAMFAWAGSPLVTGSSSAYVTGGGNNLGSYSNAQVDSLLDQLNITPVKADQVELIKQIETILWDDLASIPLFAFPGLAAYASNAQGVVFNASQAGLTWNMEDWTVSE